MATKTKRRSSRSNGKWIQKAIKRKGALTRKAKARGMTPLEFARYVVRNKKRFDTRTIRQAYLALTLNKLRKKRGSKSSRRRKASTRRRR